MVLPRPLRRLLLSYLWGPRPSHTPALPPDDEYIANYRSYYSSKKAPRPRRPKKPRLNKPSSASRLPVRAFYAALALLLVAKLAGRPLISLPLHRLPFAKQQPSNKPPTALGTRRAELAAAPAAAKEGANGGTPAPHPVQADRLVADGMRPPQFGEAAADGRDDSSGAALRALDDALAGADDELDVPDHAAPPSSLSRKASASVAVNTRRREAVANVAHDLVDRAPGEENTRTCFHSSKTGDALCVHVPFCVRHNSIVYMSDTLRCAPYSNKQGKLGTLSMSRCVELERDVEAVGEIEQVEHQPTSWLEGIEKDGNVLWFEGDTVFVRMTARCKSVTHFADRIFMLHHVLQHPERYGMGGVSNVVVAADEDVAKKIRYSKSWHHGLLKAIVHPNKILYNHKTVRELVTSVPRTPGEIRVFVPSGVWDLAKGRLVPCFRRAAVPGSVRSQFFLSEDLFPGVVDTGAETSATRFHDADVFRTMLFQSLEHEGPPRIKKEILYLHRATTRTFTDSGLDTLEAKLREMGAASGFAYRFLDVAGMTFPQQIEAVAGAGVVIGIHGTQMLNTLFLPAGSAILEIFPYGFSNKQFQGGSGAGLHYAEYQLLQGEQFPQLSEFHGLENCLRVNKECRSWYQSDNRKLNFGLLDAAAAGNLVQQAITHVQKSL